MQPCVLGREKKSKRKTIQKRPGPKSKTSLESLVPETPHSPLKLKIKRLSTCLEPAFEVVSEKKGRAAMDDMIPEGMGVLSPSHQNPSPTHHINEEVNRDCGRSTWESLAISFGFLAPEALEHEKNDSHINDSSAVPPKESKRGKKGNVAKEKDREKQEDSGISSNSEPEPSETPVHQSEEAQPEPFDPPADIPPESSVPNGNLEESDPNIQKGAEQESSDSGCEKDGSEKDFVGNEKSKEPSPPPRNPSPVRSLTILAPSALNNSVSSSLTLEPLDKNSAPEACENLNNDQLQDNDQPESCDQPQNDDQFQTNDQIPEPSPAPAPPPPVKEGITVKSPAALGATTTPNLLNIPPNAATSDPLGLLRVYPMDHSQGFMMETCEVCGERGENLEQHRAAMGHYKCHMSPDCSMLVFTSIAELSNHQHMVHSITAPAPPQQSLEQLQQQVQRIPVPFGMPTSQGIGTPPSVLGTPPPSVSPSFQHRSSPGYRVPSGITLTYPSGAPSPATGGQTSPAPMTPLIQPRPFAMQTSPSTIQPNGSPVASPALPASLGRSISISPSVSAKPAQKRTPSPAEVEPPKRSRPESPDCMLVEDNSTQKMPTLPSGISLTVRSSNKESSGVANILASRGITVTPAVSKTPPPAQSSRAQPVTTLNLSSAVSIVPASQARSQFAVPQGRGSRQVTSTVKPPTVDLTQDSPPVFRRRPQRFTCQVCDKIFTSQETLNTHLATHRNPGKLPYKCNLCNAQYPTQQAMLQHKQNYHKEAQGSEMALPVVDMKNPATIQKLANLGIRHCCVLAQLTNSSGGVFGLPIVAIDNARNPAICNLGALGASNVLSLGPAKALR